MAPEKLNQSGFNKAREIRDDGVAYPNHLHLAPVQTDNYAHTLSLNFLQDGCTSWRPTNSVKAL